MEKTTEILIITLLLSIMAEIFLLTRPKKQYQTNQISTLVDTSVLMDGRVVDLARTGFLQGQVIVPKSVLAELQLLADGSDHDKRERARLGMDAVNHLKEILGISFTLLQDGKDRSGRGVDEQLIYLAKQTDSAILTLDYNLNKVAQVEGIRVLNINELAKHLRMVHLPGDRVEIELTQKGQSADQAVGYFEDGTMVVIEQAKQWIGKVKEIEITRSLQTDAGKMMFAKLTNSKDNNLSNGSTRQASSRQNTRGRQASKGSGPGSSSSRNGQSQRSVVTKSSTGHTSSKPNATKSSARKPRTASQRESDLVNLANSR